MTYELAFFTLIFFVYLCWPDKRPTPLTAGFYGKRRNVSEDTVQDAVRIETVVWRRFDLSLAKVAGL